MGFFLSLGIQMQYVFAGIPQRRAGRWALCYERSYIKSIHGPSTYQIQMKCFSDGLGTFSHQASKGISDPEVAVDSHPLKVFSPNATLPGRRKVCMEESYYHR